MSLALTFWPLRVNYKGAAPYDIRFENATFLQGQNLDARYQFNSYRVTCRRDMSSSEKWLLGGGCTRCGTDYSVAVLDGDICLNHCKSLRRDVVSITQQVDCLK
jgi:hypothetical protein